MELQRPLGMACRHPPAWGHGPAPTATDLRPPSLQAIYVSLSLVSLVGLVGAGVAVGSGVGCASAPSGPLPGLGTMALCSAVALRTR